MKFILNFILIMAVILTNFSCQQTIAENKISFPFEDTFTINTGNIEIVKKYDLPSELNEISGMAWISQNVFACVQDEEAIIYIYDVKKSEIVNRIPFGEKGDFEALASHGSTAYVQRSDGTIFIVNNYLQPKPSVQEYKTNLTAKQNIEGIAYDAKHNRLLSVVKDKETGDVDFKGIYAFDLKTLELKDEPVFKIPANDKLYKNAGLKKATFFPSGISIYEPTANLFMVDGKQAGLLEMDTQGNILKVYALGKKDFSQAESITFDNEGNIFISSEAGKEKAHITQIKITK